MEGYSTTQSIHQRRDTRLSLVSYAWYRFQMDNAKKFARLGKLHAKEVAALANSFETFVSIQLGQESLAVRKVKAEHIEELLHLVRGIGNRIIFMRHGEQNPANETRSIADPARKKITMMRLPFNKDDPLTNQSIPEAAATGLVLLYLKQRTGKQLDIVSSENMRAWQVAEIIHKIIGDSLLNTDETWNCVNYKSKASIEDLLQALPQGTIAWKKDLIDMWCEMPDQTGSLYDTIETNVKKKVLERTNTNGNTITLIVSHTQQLAAALHLAGILESPTMRLPELAMIAFQSPNSAKILLNGVLANEEI